jgi:hypothetical protein
MDRDDVEDDAVQVVKKRPSAARTAPAGLTNAGRNDDVMDPLDEFFGGLPSGNNGEVSASGEVDPDDDDTDDWGEPKKP